MTVNVIACNLPHGRAVIESTEDVFHFNIYVSRKLSPSEQKKAVLHEMSHLLHDDLYIDLHASLIEGLLHNGHSDISEDELCGISFYYYSIDD